MIYNNDNVANGSNNYNIIITFYLIYEDQSDELELKKEHNKKTLLPSIFITGVHPPSPHPTSPT